MGITYGGITLFNTRPYLHDSEGPRQGLSQFGHLIGLLLEHKTAHQCTGLLDGEVIEHAVKEELGEE